MQSTVHLFNLAISKIGGEQLNTNISPLEQGTLGELCENLFPQVLDDLLACAPWSFAKERTFPPMNPLEYQGINHNYHFSFQLPSDCIRLISVDGYEFHEPHYIIEGQSIRTNWPKIKITYIKRITDPRLWPPHFSTALAWQLAAELSTANNNDLQKKQFCQQNAEIATARAITSDKMQQNPHEDIGDWMRARYGIKEWW